MHTYMYENTHIYTIHIYINIICMRSIAAYRSPPTPPEIGSARIVGLVVLPYSVKHSISDLSGDSNAPVMTIEKLAKVFFFL